MAETNYRGRRAVQIEDENIRLTVLVEGGHIAEIQHKPTGVNPLWTPPWPSIEPSTYSLAKHPEYGADAESKLLAGIMGHNLCLDLFGGPSSEEAKAGITVHGEASIHPYAITASADEMTMICHLPAAQLSVERHVRLARDRMLITEILENLSALDRPIAWTQHVTLGPPFLERGATQFRAPGTKSRTIEGMDFDWPHLPPTAQDLQVYTSAPSSGGYTTHLMDPHREHAYFFAWSPASKVLLGYVWKRADFPWLGIWEENHSRHNPPWNSRTMTRGMEFGASPLPETRRQMIDRNTLFGTPCYRWIPAKSTVRVEYWAFISTAKSIPESLEELQIDVPA